MISGYMHLILHLFAQLSLLKSRDIHAYFSICVYIHIVVHALVSLTRNARSRGKDSEIQVKREH